MNWTEWFALERLLFPPFALKYILIDIAKTSAKNCSLDLLIKFTKSILYGDFLFYIINLYSDQMYKITSYSY